MADENKRKSITSIDDFTEVIDFLNLTCNSIITNLLTKVNGFVRKVKVYPSLELPPYQRKVKVYPSLPDLPELERVRIIELPEHYIPTPFTEVRHVLDHEKYHRFHAGLRRWLDKFAESDAQYAELNNYEELFAKHGESAITDLYEKYFDSGLDIMDMIIDASSEIAELTKVVVEQYRQDKAVARLWKGM
jgi:hypothetical protein